MTRGGHLRTSAKPHFQCGIDSAEPAEKKVQNGWCATIKITSAPLHRQKIISIRMAIMYHISIDL